MIYLTYADLNKGPLVVAISRLSSVTGFPVKTAYTLSKLKAAVMKHVAEGQKAYTGILDEFVEKDESGRYATDDAGVKAKEGQEEPMKQALEKLLQTQVALEFEPLKLSELEKAGLSGDEITALGSLLELDIEPAAQPDPIVQTA